MTNQNAKTERTLMSKSKSQLKPKCLNAKTTPFGPLDFELDLTLELCHLTLFRIQISALANEIATLRSQ
jgi:hypothetical protein